MDFIRQLPKAEVHIHLEGCFKLETIEQLAESLGESLPRPRNELFNFTELGTSNLALGLFQTLQEHPIDILLSLAGNSIRFSYAKLERKSQLLSDLAKFGASAGKLQLAQ